MDDGRGDAQGYGWSPEVQRKAVALCLRDREAWGQLGPKVFDARWVTHPPLRVVAEVLYAACQENGDRPPSPEMLEELVRNRALRRKPEMAERIRQELALVLTADLSDARVVRAKMVGWARTEACAQAALKVVELVERGALHNGHGGEVLTLFQDALAVGRAAEASLRVVAQAKEAKEELMKPEAQKVSTGFPALDAALGGGASPGLVMVGGGPKAGKTSFLTQIAVAACRKGLTAWYLSGEVTLRPLLSRTLRSMTGFDRRRIEQDPGGSVALMQAAYSQTRGEIVLEYAPAFTVAWMASRLRQLEAGGLRVGLIIADFIDLMRGRDARAERRFELLQIGEELRALGIEAGVPIWTAKALNREAVTKVFPTGVDLAECYGLEYVVDDLFILCGTKEEQQRVVDGRRRPVIRIFRAAGREAEDKFLVGAWERDNDRQRWRYLPHYDAGASGRD